METSSVTFPIFFQDGLTSLHMAARDDLVEIVTVLLAGGANPNIRNMVGKRSQISVIKFMKPFLVSQKTGILHIFTSIPCSSVHVCFHSSFNIHTYKAQRSQVPQNHTNIPLVNPTTPTTTTPIALQRLFPKQIPFISHKSTQSKFIFRALKSLFIQQTDRVPHTLFMFFSSHLDSMTRK